MLLLDGYGRPLKRVRISVTSRCNLRCTFCHGEGLEDSSREASPREIATVVEILCGLGARDVKITGGEPLIRDDLEEIVGRISQIKGIGDIALTTNGTLLGDRAEALREEGLMRVNINFPTMNPRIYRDLTGSNWEELYRGVMAAKEAGLKPIKLNFPLLKDLNEGELKDFFHFSWENGFIPQVIELEPQGRGRNIFQDLHQDLGGVKSMLEKEAEDKIMRELQNRTIYSFGDDRYVEVVDPLENTEFCSRCNRIRVTPDLRLKPCLMRNDNLVEIGDVSSRSSILKAVIEASRRRIPYFKGVRRDF